ncbi:GIY-YIG nuclease family protein [Chloroflexota bacterium]
MYYLCLDCYFGRRVKLLKTPAVIPKPKQQYRIEYSEAWTDGYMMPDKRFIYIIAFDDKVLYVGHAVDMYKQFPELRKQKASPTTGHKARLEYLEIAANEKSAELREAELKRLLKTNPEQVYAMISEFHRNMRELGFEKD